MSAAGLLRSRVLTWRVAPAARNHSRIPDVFFHIPGMFQTVPEARASTLPVHWLFLNLFVLKHHLLVSDRGPSPWLFALLSALAGPGRSLFHLFHFAPSSFLFGDGEFGGVGKEGGAIVLFLFSPLVKRRGVKRRKNGNSGGD